MQPTIRRWFALTMLVLAALTGCGPQVDRPEVEYVEGIVTLDGKPLEAATVGLTPVSGGLPAYGNTDAAGVFKLTSSRGGLPGKGAVAGDYRVTIRKLADTAESTTAGVTDQPASEPSIEDYERWLKEQQQKNRRSLPQAKSLVPERYTNPETSGLTATIRPGSNRFEFRLTSD